MLSFSPCPEGLDFWNHVTPCSRRERVLGTHGDALRVPVAGEARDLSRHLAELAGEASSQ